MKTLFDLTGKVAAVTGAGGVLCSQMAKALAQAGAKVAVMDLMRRCGEKSRRRNHQGKAATALAVKCSVLDKKQIEEPRRKLSRN